MSRITALLFASPVLLMPGAPVPSVGDPVQGASVPALALAGSVLPVTDLAPSPEELKCRGRGGSPGDMLETVVILDDRVIEVEIPDFDFDDHSLTDADLYSFGFVCWRWIEEHFGFRINSTGLYISTVDWVKRGRENQRAALGALIAAQDRHRERHGKYAHQVEELPDFGSLADYGLPTYVELDLNATDDGWRARVSANTDWSSGVDHGDQTTGCFAFAGAVSEAWMTALGKELPGLRERQPVCSGNWDGRNNGPGGR